MRVAPVGLYFGNITCDIESIDMLATDASALTHGHELGYIPSAFFVHVIHMLANNEDVSLIDAVNDAMITTKKLFSDAKYLDDFVSIIDKAICLSKQEIDDIEAICEIGAGWVAEETLAIALYCALKYSDDFERPIISSVNHSGDSDSTGAVTRNIIGACLGYDTMPQKYLENLELKDVLIEFADDLYNNSNNSIK